MQVVKGKLNSYYLFHIFIHKKRMSSAFANVRWILQYLEKKRGKIERHHVLQCRLGIDI